MVNHFRTLLLNMSDVGDPSEHIAPGYGSKPLPIDLEIFQDVLYTKKSPRDFRILTANTYLKLIEAAGLDYAVTDLDSRITYDLTSDEYFKINRHSNPKISNSVYPIYIYGAYNPQNFIYEDDLIIQQIGFSNAVTVYSKSYKGYLNGDTLYHSPSGGAVIPLTFTNNISQNIGFGKYGFSIELATDGNFSSTNNKTWEFVITGKYNSNFFPLYNRLKNTETANYMLKQPTSINTTKFEDMWRNHFNPVYQFAALLVCYVYRLNSV